MFAPLARTTNVGISTAVQAAGLGIFCKEEINAIKEFLL